VTDDRAKKLADLERMREAYNHADEIRVNCARIIFDILADLPPCYRVVRFGGGGQPDAWSNIFQHSDTRGRELAQERALRELRCPIDAIEVNL
jgi:hypothetical protein